MYMVEISEDKMCGLYENIEKGLKYMGKAMQCVDELKSESHERSGHREYDDFEYDERNMDRYGDRMGMRGRGRYSRY